MPGEAHHIICTRLLVKGLVQGVGFRPFIYLLATKYVLKGSVSNHNYGVEIILEGISSDVDSFIADLHTKAPMHSRIDEIESEERSYTGYKDFTIIKSKNVSPEITNVSPDIAVCDECLKDMRVQLHRVNYPFVNCTHCGPRFSIIKDIPYDRANTTMHVFSMCGTCRKEYSDVMDRRYHAQPVACNHCGPAYSFHSGMEIMENYEQVVDRIANLLKNNEIVAIKGLGGFHLSCSALSEEAVQRLRDKKGRDEKPFAVMFPSLESAGEYVWLNRQEKELLTSWRRPIVLLRARQPLANSVSKGLHTIGAFLPYMPIHYDIFHRFPYPVVLTSGNLNDEPIYISNDLAFQNLSVITSHFVFHNRDIHNRVDDSVVFAVNGKPRLIRRSRGYCPEPVKTSFPLEGILATGAELVNTFALGKGNQAILSQHIGDLKNYETYAFYKETIQRFGRLFKFKPELIAHDLHPDYLSTRFAESFRIPMEGVQHHHAHIASCMAEHGLDEKVIGISFDGTGYGTDGNVWGGEFMVADLMDFERVNHFEYFLLPGGDQAVKEPWRVAVSLLYQYYGKHFLQMELPFLKEIPQKKMDLVLQVLERKINTPLSSSAGRIFDAVSAMTGLCLTSSYHAQAPVLLENERDETCKERYALSSSTPISLKGLLDGIIQDIQNNVRIAIISARFHNTLIDLVVEQVRRISKAYHLHKVVLSGGCFQNAYLLRNLENKLKQRKFETYAHSTVPCNDGGIALGQLVVAAKRRNASCV